MYSCIWLRLNSVVDVRRIRDEGLKQGKAQGCVAKAPRSEDVTKHPTAPRRPLRTAKTTSVADLGL